MTFDPQARVKLAAAFGPPHFKNGSAIAGLKCWQVAKILSVIRFWLPIKWSTNPRDVFFLCSTKK